MAEKEIDLPVSYIKHRGFFDANVLFGAIQKWFGQELYDLHLGEFKQKPGTLGSDYRYIVKADRKVTEFVKFHFELWVRCFNMKDVELIQDGKKIKTQEGQVQIEVIPKLELDWQGRFDDKNKFQKWLFDFYVKYIIKYKISDYYEDILMANAGSLVNLIKQTLGQEII